MKIIENISEAIKKSLRNWLNVSKTGNATLNIIDNISQGQNIIKNKLWYEGDPDKLEQLYRQLQGQQSKNKFWAAKCTTGHEIRKIHTGLPRITVNILTNIIKTDFNNINIPDERMDDWNTITQKNDIKNLIETAVKDTLITGDGAFKLSLNPDSSIPIIEFFSAENVEYICSMGQITEMIFKTKIKENNKIYILLEKYGYGYIDYELHELGHIETTPLSTIPETKDLVRIEFDDNFIMGVPFKIFSSEREGDHGASIFEGKTDAYDALDEAWSQWMQAIRDGRSTRYIPENMTPKNPTDGTLLKPNAFDNSFIVTQSDMTEGSKNQITVVQPAVPTDCYNQTYITALGIALQGVISPSTLGIDVKKLDNAEAQREKEKTTEYTRGNIVDSLQKTIPILVNTIFKVYDTANGTKISETKSTINFGEYANPSFEARVDTISSAKMKGIMSNETVVEELYGDTRTDEWKQAEIQRLNEKDGLAEMQTPAVNADMEA